MCALACIQVTERVGIHDSLVSTGIPITGIKTMRFLSSLVFNQQRSYQSINDILAVHQMAVLLCIEKVQI